MVGCSGSGKTTLARQLAGRLDYRHVELDALFHQPNWQPLPEQQFKQVVKAALQGDGWVAEGSYSAVRPLVREKSDLVIWLDLSKAAVMRQLFLRTLRRLVLRETLWNGNREHWSNLFKLSARQSILVWAWTKHAIYRQRYGVEMEASLPSQRYVRLDSRRAVDCFLKSLPNGLAPLSE